MQAMGLQVGDPVEVLVRFTNRWARGFSLAEVRPDGVGVRRHSDGRVLPAPFPPSEVRPVHDHRAEGLTRPLGPQLR
jgi:hypothetical protein